MDESIFYFFDLVDMIFLMLWKLGFWVYMVGLYKFFGLILDLNCCCV